MKCYNDAANKFDARGAVTAHRNVESIPDECNCLPACTSITYETSVSRKKNEFPNKNLKLAFFFHRIVAQLE